MKRRRLTPNTEVVLIYVTGLGYLKEPALFTSYRRIMVGDTTHEVPVFTYNDKEIVGTECFWLLPENATNDDFVLKIQKQLTALQIKAFEIAKEMDYTMPEKVEDPMLKDVANENVDRIQKVIKKFGFDPRDETWIETHLAVGQREINWFKYERENSVAFSENWEDIVTVFNKEYGDNISVDQAKNMSKKRMRYYLGAHHTRMSGNGKVEDWVTAARGFEKAHRERESRMITWSLLHKERFPLVRTKEPIKFWPGPYFHQFLEKFPQLFDSPKLGNIRKNVVLRVISYDKQDNYIRLDFTDDIRKVIKPDENKDTKIWIKDQADYDLWLKPEQIETHLEILDSLD